MNRRTSMLKILIVGLACLAQVACINDFHGTVVIANLKATAASLTKANQHLDVWVTINDSIFRIGRWSMKRQEVDLPGGLLFNELQVQSLDTVVQVVREKGSLTDCKKDADCTVENEVCSDDIFRKVCKLAETQYLKIGVLDQEGPRLVLIGGVEYRIPYNLKKAVSVFFTVESDFDVNEVPTGPVVIEGTFLAPDQTQGRGVQKADLYRAGFLGQENFRLGRMTFVVAEDNASFL
ncbi:MAG: hypothetical protein KC609_11470 [Myxococcales bacterium]|nr:hypothetical protein [Myxococcales bacterium]